VGEPASHQRADERADQRAYDEPIMSESGQQRIKTRHPGGSQQPKAGQAGIQRHWHSGLKQPSRREAEALFKGKDSHPTPSEAQLKKLVIPAALNSRRLVKLGPSALGPPEKAELKDGRLC